MILRININKKEKSHMKDHTITIMLSYINVATMSGNVLYISSINYRCYRCFNCFFS